MFEPIFVFFPVDLDVSESEVLLGVFLFSAMGVSFLGETDFNRFLDDDVCCSKASSRATACLLVLVFGLFPSNASLYSYKNRGSHEPQHTLACNVVDY